jgi:alkanesulfonate monooxygenase SsuD/methylene tetrahydromethanopterin reductase-like flavin-dependent oxidoreductase (luciferase family)
MSTNHVVFGVHAYNGVADVRALLQFAQHADREGLDFVSVPDHPYLGDRLDAYALIAFILGRTQRISGLVNVTNVPTRPAPMLARTATSLSALSDGRLILGVGAGGDWDRIADLGVPRLRGGVAVDAFEEAIAVVKLLAGGGPPASHHGPTYRLHEIAPAGVPAPPVWTGSVGPKSLAVTGRAADGWIPGHAADWLSTRYRASRPVIDEAAHAAGRDPRDIRTVYNLPGQITDTPLATTRDTEGRWIGGSVAQWIDELTGAVLDYDAGGFILFSPTWGPADDVALGRWAAEIAPAVREAVETA